MAETAARLNQEGFRAASVRNRTDDVRALAVFMKAIEEAQTLDRHSVRNWAADQFDTARIVEGLIASLQTARFLEVPRTT